jgi:hypothetical protein
MAHLDTGVLKKISCTPFKNKDAQPPCLASLVARRAINKAHSF